ncbi:MAG: 3'-5' exonuclease [Burkholderiales bacterium]|nr:3'-5' exonuclease [Burkholderiales bacterium]
MNPWHAWRERRLDPDLRAALAAWRSHPQPALGMPALQLRCVVIDTETSGLDPHADRLLSIGAVALSGGALDFSDAFDTTLRQREASEDANILVHGLGAAAQLDGEDPAVALTRLLAWAGRAPMVAYHAPFDARFIERAMDATLALRWRVPWLDLTPLLPQLFEDCRAASLDEWLTHFDIDPPVRHSALGDALATAQLAQIAFARAADRGLIKLGQLLRAAADSRWLRRG